MAVIKFLREGMSGKFTPIPPLILELSNLSKNGSLGRWKNWQKLETANNLTCSRN